MKLLTNLTFIMLCVAASAFGQRSLAGHAWALTYVKGAQIGTVKAYLTIDSSGRRFTGNTGCNIMNGTVRMSGSRIRFSAVTTTKRACTRETAPVEGAVLSALSSATGFKRSGELLRLYSGRTLLAQFHQRSSDVDEEGPANPVDQLGLEDRRWILESIAGTAIPKVEQEASIVFDPVKGSAGGDTSCNAYGGSYKNDGNKLAITEVIYTMRACIEDERMNIERRFLDGLRSADRYEIKANKLMFFRRNRLLLTFVGRKK